MKIQYLALAVVVVLALPACEKKPVVEQAEDSVNDALDNRPAEPVQDAAEDAADAVKDATN